MEHLVLVCIAGAVAFLLAFMVFVPYWNPEETEPSRQEPISAQAAKASQR